MGVECQKSIWGFRSPVLSSPLPLVATVQTIFGIQISSQVIQYLKSCKRNNNGKRKSKLMNEIINIRNLKTLSNGFVFV